MTGGVDVRPVRSPPEERAFLELPYRLHGDDPLWVPPLRAAERARWRPRDNPSLAGRWHRRFVAWQGERAVGRVAAIVDDAFARRWSAGAGFFGFLECEADEAVAGALLRAAETALGQRGAVRVLGPVSLTTHDEVGLLVGGLDRPPAVLTPFNPPSHPALLESAGYAGVRDYHAYEWTAESPATKAVHRLALRQPSGSSALRVRPADPRRWDAEVHLLAGLYNDSFADVWGFVPTTLDEFRERARQFRSFYRPELVLVAEWAGCPAGFAVLLPDVNEALPAARGRLLPLGWLRLARALPRIRSGRFILLGVRPDFAGRGVAPALVAEMGRAVRRVGLTRVEASLVLEENARMRRVIEAFGGRRSRTYRLFGKELPP